MTERVNEGEMPRGIRSSKRMGSLMFLRTRLCSRPSERLLLRGALKELSSVVFPGERSVIWG